MLFDQNEGSFAPTDLNNSRLSKICWSRAVAGPIWDDACALHDTVFGGSEKTLLNESIRKPFPLLLTAYCEKGNPIAFKLGYELKPFRFYSWLGGVLNSHRKFGIASVLMKIQHQILVELGYTEVETKTKNKRKEMLILNLKSGFEVIGCYTDHTGEPKIILRKGL